MCKGLFIIAYTDISKFMKGKTKFTPAGGHVFRKQSIFHHIQVNQCLKADALLDIVVRNKSYNTKLIYRQRNRLRN